MIELDPTEYAYVQVTGILTARIQAGQYPRKLPAERDLAEELGVSYVTVRHATAILRERGLIITRHGRGTFVAPDARPAPD
jgi:GntR family transcriptional regulator